MANDNASAILKEQLKTKYGDQVPGCVFYVTRNGAPFADGSFGWARMPGAPDGPLPMTPRALVHVGSVGKFFCAVAILRLIQEWNSIFDRLKAGLPPPDVSDSDATLYITARKSGAKIYLETQMFPLVEPFLDKRLIASYSSFPGTNVRNITLRQLLTHTSARRSCPV